MSKISDLIFNGASHYISSPYGNRGVIQTSAGSTSSFHQGTDYATYNKKIPQYAIEDGTILSCGQDTAANGYALFVWVSYPRIGKKFLHYHLDSISVKAGQTVKKGTLLGYTGMTGNKATGIHLHLGVKDLKTGAYEDPEKLNYSEPSTSFLPKRGYFQKGDKSPEVKKICDFFVELLKGDTYGDYCEACVKVFQQKNGITADGKVGKKTLPKMKEKGFKE